ncbi:MAG: adenylate cyclase [Chlorobi bacterium OLB5]|nr:MAG: adenylate cyclase [Chlorobi bacterium OLB5]
MAGIQTFNTELEIEKTQSEYKRVRIISVLLAAGLILGTLNTYFNLFGFLSFFKFKNSAYATIIWLFLFLCYETIFLLFLKKLVIEKKVLDEKLRLIHSLMEILFPGIIMFIMTYIEQRAVYLDSPFFMIYFILIAISALQLSFRISFSTGILAALQYILLTVYCFNTIIPQNNISMNLPAMSYYARGIILLFTGYASGMVAREINQRVMNSFRQMREQQNIMNLFGQQVSKEIVEELISRKDKPGIQRINASIMFLDIRNFSSYAETRDPAEIIEFQNNIFNPIIEIINNHNGLINQFLGDGFMASFGIPIAAADHEQQAFEAGIKIIRKIKELGEKNIIPATAVGLGLHSGEVITGNIGNEIRKQYSITGTTVITAARLEQMNKEAGTQFLISREFFNKININGLKYSSLGEKIFKGFEKPVEVICIEV